MAEAAAQGFINPVFADIEDHVKGLGVPGDVGLERVERVTERDGSAVISGLGHGVISEEIGSGGVSPLNPSSPRITAAVNKSVSCRLHI